MNSKFNVSARQTISLILFIVNVIIFSSCDNSTDVPSGPIPIINTITPSFGQPGIGITISGTNFGSNPQNAKISFAGPGNTMISSSVNGTGSISGETILYTSVPVGAITGKIQVAVNGVVGASANNFEILSPVEDLTISPLSGSVGNSIIITGATFSAVSSENIVTFTTTSGARTSAIARVSTDGTYIVARIPDNVANGPIQVSYNKALHSSKVPFVIRPCNVSTYAGGSDGYVDGIGTSAKFYGPKGMAILSTNLYVADVNNNKIRKVEMATGTVTTLAGNDYGFADGIGVAAKFNSPAGITVGADGKLYVADTWNHRIRMINPSTGEVTTVAGSATYGNVDGVGAAAQLRLPTGITTGPDGIIYFTESSDSHRVRKFNPTTGLVTTLAGNGTSGSTDGVGLAAQFFLPEGIVVANGSLYVADNGNELIRRINLTNNSVTTIAGGAQELYKSTDGVGLKSSFNSPVGMASDGNYLFVTDAGYVRRIDLTNSAVTTLAGTLSISFAPKNGACSASEFSDLYGIVRGTDGTLFLTEGSGFSVDLSLIRKVIP